MYARFLIILKKRVHMTGLKIMARTLNKEQSLETMIVQASHTYKGILIKWSYPYFYLHPTVCLLLCLLLLWILLLLLHVFIVLHRYCIIGPLQRNIMHMARLHGTWEIRISIMG